MTRDYKETMFLPKTNFSLQGVKDEMKMARLLQTHYAEMKAKSKERPCFVLHDGPPYANGNLHMGHALNKILKDITVRAKYGMGYQVNFVPGWDCHGLPIEWQVEKDFAKQGIDKSSLKINEFRHACREYAATWVTAQCEQFEEYGIAADWRNLYATSQFKSEAKIAKQLHDIAKKDLLYRGTKPILWSIVEQTALAEAEVEHQDLRVTSVYVRFPQAFRGMESSIVVWTTTPWTLPANKAIAFNPDIEYAEYRITGIKENSTVNVGEHFIIAKKLVDKVMEDTLVSAFEEVKIVYAEDLLQMKYDHPIVGFDKNCPIIIGNHVTDDIGTGFVHIAPEHGPEDYQVWTAYSTEMPTTVNADGTYHSSVSRYAGMHVLQQTSKGDWIFEYMNQIIEKDLLENNTLLRAEKIKVSYPHSWRSKAPLIYRNTPQWFMKVDAIKPAAMVEIEKTNFIPASGRNRLNAAIENRPDWLLSRQRVWGTPMSIFAHKETNKILCDGVINNKIIETFKVSGGDAWFNLPIEYWFDGSEQNPDEYEMIEDVLDVWFDSGASYVLADIEQADLYLEGSDQHRGWFGSSLLESVAIQGKAPFKTVLTHGFVLDEKGKKMSKSVGNVVDPKDIAAKYGTDVIRLWVASSDYKSDIKIGNKIMDGIKENYKKLRNSLRFLISNLVGFTDEEKTHYVDMSPIDHYLLHILRKNDVNIKTAYEDYNYVEALRLISDFCSNDLSAFYFDIQKDSLYCDRPDNMDRRSCRTTMSIVFDVLIGWLAPIIPFTTAEACLELGRLSSRMVDVADSWDNELENDRWVILRQYCDAVNLVMETKRKEKLIGSSLEAAVVFTVPKDFNYLFLDIDIAAVFRCSQVTIVTTTKTDISVDITKAIGNKCARSWRILPEVGSIPEHPDLSVRDADAVNYWDFHHARN